jgi:hypothetical protein
LAAVGGALVWGLTLALWASLKQGLAVQPPAEGGLRLVARVLNISLIPMTLLCGVLIDRLGVRGVLIGGCAVLAVALLWLSMQPPWPRNLLAVLLAGLGGAAVSVSSLVLMPWAFFGPREAMAAVAVGSVFVALGALVTSALADVMRTGVGRKRGLALLALVCLLPAFPAALAAEESLKDPGLRGEAPALLEQQDIWLAALVFLFYVPLEAAVALWTAPTLAGAADEKGRGNLMVGFWVAFVVSRLAVAAVLDSGWLPLRWDAWLPVLPLLVAVALGNLASASTQARLRLGVWCLGALLGPVLPALLGVLLQMRKYQEWAGTCCGLLLVAGSLGGLLMAPLLRPGDSRPAASLRLPMFLALGLTAVTLVFALSVSW